MFIASLCVALVGLAAIVAVAVIVRVRDRQGRETVVRAPEGSKIDIGSNGEIDVTLPEGAGQAPASAQPDFEPDPPPNYGPDAPKLALAPFSADEARKHQERWAAYLKVPREETNSIGMKTVLVPPGEFEMGSTREDIEGQINEAKARNDQWVAKQLPNEGPRHRVRITSAFRMGAHEVTVAQFRRFVEETRYLTEGERDGKGAMVCERSTGRWTQSPKTTWRTPGLVQGDEHPVIAVSWNDAAAFCRWLGAKEAKRYRLPTEAEWEYACRAGTTTRYTCGDDAAILRDYAWSQEEAPSKSHPVGQKKPNGFGLFDMHGNVWEWCADWYDPRYYSSEPLAADPRGPAAGVSRVIRGGSRDYRDQSARSANRAWSQPFRRTVNIGLRIVVPVSRPPDGKGPSTANP
jgi:formylglycine-generating enzyme required for sulfatase activity